MKKNDLVIATVICFLGLTQDLFAGGIFGISMDGKCRKLEEKLRVVSQLLEKSETAPKGCELFEDFKKEVNKIVLAYEHVEDADNKVPFLRNIRGSVGNAAAVEWFCTRTLLGLEHGVSLELASANALDVSGFCGWE